jgi:hypothetical protein
MDARGRLHTHRYLDWESEPYEPAIKDPEAMMLREMEMFAAEQPDFDFGDEL